MPVFRAPRVTATKKQKGFPPSKCSAASQWKRPSQFSEVWEVCRTRWIRAGDAIRRGGYRPDGIKDDAPFTYFREYMEAILDWLQSRDLRVLLLLDEFDKLQEGIDSGITSPQVPENLRFLLQSESRLTAILTSMKRLRRIREEYFSALYGLGTPFDVTSLSKEDAETLVTKPVKGSWPMHPTPSHVPFTWSLDSLTFFSVCANASFVLRSHLVFARLPSTRSTRPRRMC